MIIFSQTFVAPHDVAVSRDGTFVVVGEIRHRGEKNLWKFNRLQESVQGLLPQDYPQELPQEDEAVAELEEAPFSMGRP